MERDQLAPPARVEVVDCTLRDGEQAPGVAFTLEEKLEIATALSDAGVDVLDAGFPANGARETETVREMRGLGLRAAIAATARPLAADVAAAHAASAQQVFLFMPTSDFRIARTLGITRDSAVECFRDGAERVVGHGMGLSIVFEDATRADPDFLVRVIDDLCSCMRVERVVVADTVGCATPELMTRLVGALAPVLPPGVALTPHCHNDFGLATANTLAAVAAGCPSLTCTVNALGERAGNADLAEVAAALRYLYGIEHGVELPRLEALSQLVERLSGMHTSFAKPVTGLNVFRHESGIHVDGMLKDPLSYEFLPSEDLGRRTEFVLGKHSGGALVDQLLRLAGIEHPGERGVAELLARVEEEVLARGREQHERMYEERRAFFASHVSGLGAEELARLARARGARAQVAVS